MKRTNQRLAGALGAALPIPENLRCGMYAEGYGQFDLGRTKFLDLPEDARRPACNDCPSCTVHCAYGVRVAERVSRTRELLA